MDERIDFNIIGRDGGNIFKQCFQPAIQLGGNDYVGVHNTVDFNSRNNTNEQCLAFIQNLVKLQYKHSLVPAIEDRFFKLVKAGQKYGYDIDAIIEKPDLLGSTVFEAATYFSFKICMYILNRNIRVNNIQTNFVYPAFHPTSVVMWEKMLRKGINPKVITGRV